MTTGQNKTKRRRASNQKRAHLRLLIFIGSAAVVLLSATIASISILHARQIQAQSLPTSYSPAMYSIRNTLTHHQMSTLVADSNMLNALRPVLDPREPTFALNACPSSNDAVTQNLQKRSLAVLVFIDDRLSPHQCTLAQIVLAYGRPNASETITGTPIAPRELMLFYDAGLQLSGPSIP